MPSRAPTIDFSRVGVVVPIKAFHQAKERLSDLLTPAERIALTKHCAEQVIRAAQKFETFVVCDDPQVAQWARERSAQVVWQPEVGLNLAVRAGVDFAKSRDKALAIISHSDLPLATNFAALLADQTDDFLASSITLAPDRHHDGTNVIVLPTNLDFEFCYGKRSFDAHRRIAEKLGLQLRVIDDASFAVDIDTAEDLAFAQQLKTSNK
ncbi:MAG: 2-phospho-L-lactate guanylyltransferase [Actinomycetota bacterium]